MAEAIINGANLVAQGLDNMGIRNAMVEISRENGERLEAVLGSRVVSRR